MDMRYIVLYKNGSVWEPSTNGVFKERRLADNFIECRRATGWANAEYAIVSGPLEIIKEGA